MKGYLLIVLRVLLYAWIYKIINSHSIDSFEWKYSSSYSVLVRELLMRITVLMRITKVVSMLIYFFTALLPVHAFAMHAHWSSNEHIHNNHNHQHTSDTHHHTNDVLQDCECDEHWDMQLCLEQSLWTMSGSYSLIETIWNAWYVQPDLHTLLGVDDVYVLKLLVHNNDPWWDLLTSFQRFIATHYWELVLHC